jgi:ssDNA-binding Zn-finger/Zn-ribbon topoisomerase 1
MELKKMEMKPSYTCSMHPEVVSDKKGECPKCGMKLVVKKKEMEKKSEHKHH